MRPNRRAAYTLMEVTVALAIAVLLLAAVYCAFFVSTAQTNAGRNIANRSSIARAIFTRLNEDINCHLAPIDPRVTSLPEELSAAPSAEAQGTDSSTTDANTGNAPNTGTSTTTGNTNTSSTTSNNTGSNSGAAPAETPSFYTPFNYGVQGTSQTLTLYVTKVPRRRASQVTDADVEAQLSPDLRRISYWLAQGPGGALGLAREELDLRLYPEALNALPFNRADQANFVIAPDVVRVEFEYFDGAQWTTEWDGMQPGADGKTPIGPPMAIAIVVEIAEAATLNGQRPTHVYRHVVDIPTANGPGSPDDPSMILPQ